jgi:hypothetical protein
MNNWNGIISLLIACIELVLIINIVIFAEKNRFNKIVILILVILMIYQLLEFIICQLTYSSSFLSWLAFSDISFLPLFNLILIYSFFIKKSESLKFLFIMPVIFIIYYAIVLDKFQVTTCTVFYAVYNYPLGTLYGAYYYLTIGASLYFLIFYIKTGTVPKNILYAWLLLIGHIIMTIPVIFAFLFAALKMSGLLNAIESVMCKFAFFYALCLTFFALNNKEALHE